MAEEVFSMPKFLVQPKNHISTKKSCMRITLYFLHSNELTSSRKKPYQFERRKYYQLSFTTFTMNVHGEIKKKDI